MQVIAALSFSTKVTWCAPLLSASIPIEPEPANRSRKREPSICPWQISKTALRRIASVGRVESPLGVFKRRPRNVPPMILIIQKRSPRRIFSAAPLPFADECHFHHLEIGRRVLPFQESSDIFLMPYLIFLLRQRRRIA